VPERPNSCTILFAGASGGIGLETTQIFLGWFSSSDYDLHAQTQIYTAQGANITAHYNSQRAPLLPLLEQYGPGRVHLAQADLVSEEEVTALFSSASNALGPIEVAVVNHGYYPSAHVPLAEMELSQWRATHDTNLTSSFLVCRAFLRGLTHLVDERKHCASIILVGSTAGKFGEAGHADYASTKSG
jgi:NAD(P)-dependent dehydrogenase (short-subunit alcohol dehydrogenase family)